MDMIIKSTSNSQLKSSSASVEIVLNDDENLLTLILLHVPWKKLMTLKSVSRQWHSVITNPHLVRLRNLLPLCASGLFIQCSRIFVDGSPPQRVYYVPLDDPDTLSPTFAHNPFDPEKILIQQSCNGLFLCSDSLSNFFIYNPCTNQLAVLPKHTSGSEVYHVGLAYDPSKSVHYKVIAYVSTSQTDSVVDFDIYSSETRTWGVSVQSFFLDRDIVSDSGVYWNGCIHWLSQFSIKCISPEWAVHNGLYFDVEEGRLETFPLPPMSADLNSEWSLYFGESEDHLHFIEVCPCTTSFSVYEMKSDHSEWFVKYRIDLAPVFKVFPEITNHKAFYHDRNKYAVSVLSLIRRENFGEDSFLVLGIPGKAIRYNLVDRSFKVMWNFVAGLGLENIDCSYRELQVWPCFETHLCN